MDYKQLHDWCWRWKFAWRKRNHTLGGVQNIRVCDCSDVCWCCKCMCEVYVFTYVFVSICVLYTHLFVFTLRSLISFSKLAFSEQIGWNKWLIISIQFSLQFPNYVLVIYALWIGLNNVFNKSIGYDSFINQSSVVHAFSFTPSLQGWWQTTSSISGRAYISSRERWCVILNNLVMIVCIACPSVSGYILHTILFC